MRLPEIIANYFLNYHSFFYWRDMVEVMFFAALFYYAALWLKKDKQKNLLPYFYSYCFCAFSTHYLNLTTISYALFLFAPVAAMIFILVHQDLLQKNIVALKNITPAKRMHIDWLETLIRTSLLAVDDNKSITCVIERTDALQDFLETSFYFNARLEQNLLNILLTSSTFEEKKMLWVNTEGKLIAINTTWIKTQKSFDNQQHQIPEWKEEALFFSAKTDAIILHISPESRTFDMVINGMVIDRMHATKTLELIKKYVMTKGTTSILGDRKHEKSSQKSTAQ